MVKTNVVIAGILFAVFILVLGCTEQIQSESSNPQSQSGIGSSSGQAQGRAVLTITDAAANMGSVTSVKLTIDSVKVHSSSEGWVTLSTNPKTYDLLKLKMQGKQELLLDTQINEGTYDQIRLDVSNVIVTDAKGEHETKLPSNVLKINANLVAKANQTTTANFDFVADESLHKAGNGKYILAPVIHIETRDNADVELKSENDVHVTGGIIKTNMKVGMDAEGNVGFGVRLPEDANLTIDGELFISGENHLIKSE